MEFHLGHKSAAGNPSPPYNQPYGSQLPPVQAQGNLTYLQFIDVIGMLWEEANPEIRFVPMAGEQLFTAEKGYIVYSGQRTTVKGDQIKPRVHDHVSTVDGARLLVFIQSFDHLVRFSALHQDPRVAEEIQESFEDFLIFATVILKRMGLEEIVYNRRVANDTEKRFGADLKERATEYMVTTQKILMIEQERLQEAFIMATTAVGNTGATPNGTFITSSVS